MDEKMKENGHGETCGCGMCKMGMGGMWGGCGCGHHHHGRHFLAKIIILIFVFWLGSQFGELKAFHRGYGMMDGYGYPNGMMQGYYGGYNEGYTPVTSTGPTAPASPAGQ